MDLTERKKLKKTEESFKKILDTLPSIIIGIDSNRWIAQWNLQAEKLTRTEFGQVIGMRLDDVIPEFKATYKNIDKVLAEGSIQQIKNFSICSDGEFKYYNITIFPVELVNESYVAICIADVTKKERKDAHLRQLQKFEMVGTIAAGLVHDFNNILGAIIGTVNTMKLELSEDPILDRGNLINDLDAIDKIGRRAVKMVEQLLSVSRNRELSMTRIDLNESVKNVLLLCSNTFDKSVSITEEYSEQPAYVNGDASQIEQVILNLCINACHAMTIMRVHTDSWGGVLSVSIRDYMPDQSFIKSHPEVENRNYRVVSFKDSGIGMRQEILDKIFIPFFSTKEDGSGTGLGLAMVCSIIKQHNGVIDVFSGPGIGSEFRLYIPALRL